MVGQHNASGLYVRVVRLAFTRSRLPEMADGLDANPAIVTHSDCNNRLANDVFTGGNIKCAKVRWQAA